MAYYPSAAAPEEGALPQAEAAKLEPNVTLTQPKDGNTEELCSAQSLPITALHYLLRYLKLSPRQTTDNCRGKFDRIRIEMLCASASLTVTPMDPPLAQWLRWIGMWLGFSRLPAG